MDNFDVVGWVVEYLEGKGASIRELWRARQVGDEMVQKEGSGLDVTVAILEQLKTRFGIDVPEREAEREALERRTVLYLWKHYGLRGRRRKEGD